MSLLALVVGALVLAKWFTVVHRKTVIEDIRRQGGVVADVSPDHVRADRRPATLKPSTSKKNRRFSGIQNRECVTCGWSDGLRRDGTCPRCDWLSKKQKAKTMDTWEYPNGPHNDCAGCGIKLINVNDPLCADCRIFLSRD